MSLRTSMACLVVLSFLSTAPSSAAEAGLEARVSGVRNAKGQVGCLLFASADGFPGDIGKARQALLAPIVDGTGVCKFEAPAGSYAIVAMHDENANGKLDKGVMGVPKEGYGASRGARGAFGPRYDDARFDYRGGGMTMPITIRY
jgi:uncharacterized protein (DUF2141 family)